MSAHPMLNEQVSRLLSRHWPAAQPEAERELWPEKLWAALAEAGIFDLLVPEDAGGLGGDLQQAAIIGQLVGAHAVPVPVCETMIGRRMLAGLGVALDEAPVPVALAFQRAGPAVGRPPFSPQGSSVTIPWPGEVAVVLLSRLPENGTDEARVAAYRSGDWHVEESFANLAGEPRGRVRLEAARADAPLGGFGTPDPLGLHALLKAAQLAGAMQTVVEIVVGYAKERVQFGRPIGAFQAIQQMTAEMASHAAAASVAVDAAAVHDLPALAWSAKIRAGEAASRVAAIAHQVVGAIGYTREFRLHHFTRRLWSWRDEAGDETYWSARLADAAFASPGLWPFLTSPGADLAVQRTSDR